MLLQAINIQRRSASLGLLAALVTILAGCTHNYSYVLTSGGEELTDRFPAVRAAATETVTASPDGFTLQVHHPPGAEEQAAKLLELLAAPVHFLQRETGHTPPGQANAYLASWPTGEPRPHVQPRGPGVVTGVLFLRPDRSLLAVDWNRDWYYGTYPHELAHHFLAGLANVDRWLSDGLPEHLAAEFTRRHSEEAYLAADSWNPPLVALDRVDLEPWTHEDFRRMERARTEDPERAFLIGWQSAWRYAAAQELMRRWLGAASTQGVENPVRDLVARVEAAGARTLDDLRTLAREQTGRNLEDLAHLTPSERASAVRAAWDRLDHPNPSVQTHALRTLQFFGLPPGAEPTDLLQTALRPHGEDSPRDWYFWQALGGAVAATGDVTTNERFVETIGQRFTNDEARRRTPPAVWQVLLPEQPSQARRELVETINDPRVPLPVRADANAVLEAATGRSVGWSVDATPQERAAAAEEWLELLG